jgi:lipopolysaccharide export system protein LptC
MNRFLFPLLGIIALCLVFWVIKQNYFSAAETANSNSDLTRAKSNVEVQAQKIDLKKTVNESGQ